MRFVLDPPDPSTVDDLVREAHHAAGLGFDAMLCRATPTLPASLVTAAAVLARVPVLRVVAEIPLGDQHPLLAAEEAAVVDVAGAGRLILLIRPAPGVEERFLEAATLLRTALRARPFRFTGEHWTVPANLPTNNDHEDRYRMMPAPYQPRMEIWCAGVDASVALDHGFGHLADTGTPAEVLADSSTDPLRLDLARARHDPWHGEPDPLVDRLRAGRSQFGQDWSVVRADAEGMARIAGSVRPRIQLDRLPEGLADGWADGWADRSRQDQA